MKLIIVIIVAVIFWGSLLSQIAKILGAILNPLNSILVGVKNRKKEGFIKQFNKLQLNDAYNTDVFLHRNLRTLWNFSLSKQGWKFKKVGYIFGKEGETLSSATGHKAHEKTLSIIGWGLYFSLYLIDLKNITKGGHCKVAYINFKNKTK